jgi:hypothetical protein
MNKILSSKCNCRSVSQIPCILWNPNINARVYKILLSYPVENVDVGESLLRNEKTDSLNKLKCVGNTEKLTAIL